MLSVWTTFPFSGNTVQTNYLPVGNEISGIGLETLYGGTGLFASDVPPLQAVLVHNDVTALVERGEVQGAPVSTAAEQAAFADYLFLLELSHRWGPQVRVTGTPADRLIGFDFHWSFFMRQVSPAGGNPWVDNGDGTFTTAAVDLPSLTYSPLDLYLMGVASAEEVPPFVFLRDVAAPADAIDPFRNRTVSTVSFPWQGPEPLTVTGTAETLTIDDIIEANGARRPAVGAAPTEFTVGVVIVAASTASAEDIVALQALGGQRATAQAAAFARATGDRARIRLVSSSTMPTPAPTPDEDNTDDTEPAAGCATGSASSAGALCGLLALRRRRCRVL